MIVYGIIMGTAPSPYSACQRSSKMQLTLSLFEQRRFSGGPGPSEKVDISSQLFITARSYFRETVIISFYAQFYNNKVAAFCVSSHISQNYSNITFTFDMLSRSSGDASARLRRAKSASSVQRHRKTAMEREPVDPELTRQQALTAASRAMQRAGERTSVDSRGSYDIPRHNDRATRKRTMMDPPTRPQSIRFIDNEGSVGHGSLRYPSPRPPSTVNTMVNGEDSPPETVTMPLPQISELGTIDGGISSTPSSYRKLRRAKSMFSTRQRTMERNRQVSDVSEDDSRHMGVLRRSISFIKGQSGPSLRKSKSQTAAVQLARDQFLRDLAQQSQMDHSASARKPKREHKPFKKTVRNSEIRNSDRTTVSSQLEGPWSAREGGLGSKARFFSLSIKKGLKRVFRRSSANQHGNQEQQQHEHASECNTRPQSGMDLDTQDFSAQDYFQRHQEYYGSADGYLDSAESVINRPQSIRTMSSDSLDTTNSRVTSWTDSTTHQIPARHSSDRNRLSIIQEHGGHDPPLSRVPTNGRNGYAVFSKPLRMPGGTDDMRGSVDTQRVYSALRKQIDGNRARQNADDSTSIRFGPSVISPPERTSSIYSNRTCHTIRPVPSDLSIKSIKSVVRARAPSVRSQITIRSSYPSDEIGLTPQQIAHENERIAHRRSKQSVRDVNSSFFSPISDRKLRTPSPVKGGRSLDHGLQPSSEDDSGSTIVYQPPYSGDESVSPSIYSRETDNDTPKRNKDDGLFPLAECGQEERGTATILASHRLPYRPSGDRASSRSSERAVRASTDWKMWMSSQMNGLDSRGIEDTQCTSFGKPHAKHVRENAQIDDEDEKMGNRQFMQQSSSFDNGSVFDVSEPQQAARCGTEVRRPLVELKTVPQNNFSRPMRRSPNPSMPDLSPLFRKSSDMSQAQSKPDISSDSFHSRKSKESPRSNALPTNQTSSPWIPSKRSQSALLVESPTRDRSGPRQTVSLRGHYGSTPTKYGHDMTSSDSGRSNSVRTRERSRKVTNENVRVGATDSSYLADDEASHQMKPGDPLYSTTSSKRMVDLFLSSRRRNIGASDDSASEPVFL